MYPSVHICFFIRSTFTNLRLYSYIGKGIIQASPQAVMDAVKNPRTRYTYDDSLKVNFQILIL